MPMLNTWYNSASSTPPFSRMIWKIGGISHEPFSTTASHLAGSTRGMLSTNPPPVMCASALMAPAVVGFETGLNFFSKFWMSGP